jgi:hypothetical protein
MHTKYSVQYGCSEMIFIIFNIFYGNMEQKISVMKIAQISQLLIELWLGEMGDMVY